jgi:GMP synthase-like glutamine amidotransferase
MIESTELFEFLGEKEYNYYKEAHLIFFSKTDKEFLFLLSSDESSNYKSMFTQVLLQDNVPPYAISRLMITDYKGLFTPANIQKILTSKPLKNEDLLHSINWHEIWETHAFWDWLNIISQNPIQIDNIKGTIIYFIEIPLLSVQKLNNNLESLNYPFKFKFFSSEEIINGKNIDITISKIFQKINIENHIYETLQLRTEENQDTYIILSSKPAEKDIKERDGIYHFPCLFQGIYRKNKEKWFFYTVDKDGLPDESQLKSCKAIILPGAQISVYENLPHLMKIMQFIQKVRSNYSHIKILGICFGAQITTKALGGEVKKRNGSFVSGVEQIKIKKRFYNIPFVTESQIKKFKVHEVFQLHGDEISKIPEGFQLLASSDTCKNEIFSSLDERILLFQGHPEYDSHFLLNRKIMDDIQSIDPMYKNKLYADQLKEYYLSMQKYRDYDKHAFRKVCNTFIKSHNN